MYQMVIKSQMVIKCSKWQLNISTVLNVRPSKIYPNWDFWFENKPSGNPASNCMKIECIAN
jgi:hypothetical protein